MMLSVVVAVVVVVVVVVVMLLLPSFPAAVHTKLVWPAPDMSRISIFLRVREGFVGVNPKPPPPVSELSRT